MSFFRPPTPAGESALRIQLCYFWRHLRFARLRSPQRLTEWIQHRKLYDRDPRLPLLADKVRAKELVGALLGQQWIVPTLWRGPVLPASPAWPYPYVVKSRHGSQQVMIVRDLVGHRAAVKRSRLWTEESYGAWLDEWLYGQIPRGLLVERYIGTEEALPVDYKLFVFGGKVHYVQVHLDRACNHRWIVMDRNWKRVSSPTDDKDPERPATLLRMIAAAERLGAGIPFVRADFYEVDDNPIFGELTFYPGSGLERIEPRRLDLEMGVLWKQALVPTPFEESLTLAA